MHAYEFNKEHLLVESHINKYLFHIGSICIPILRYNLITKDISQIKRLESIPIVVASGSSAPASMHKLVAVTSCNMAPSNPTFLKKFAESLDPMHPKP